MLSFYISYVVKKRPQGAVGPRAIIVCIRLQGGKEITYYSMKCIHMFFFFFFKYRNVATQKRTIELFEVSYSHFSYGFALLVSRME
jgi:hypothetical protein